MSYELIKNIKKIESDAKKLRTEINKIKLTHISTSKLKTDAGSIASEWFKIRSEIKQFGIPDETIDSYTIHFKNLLTLSQNNQRKSSYLAVLAMIIPNFKKEIIIPVMTNAPSHQGIRSLDEIIQLVKGDEQDYLKEAKGCEEKDFYRASVILGWCAVAYRIHNKIQKIGFSQFNQASNNIQSIKTGRYAKFKRTYTINSTAELQNIPDSYLLIILEYLNIIDSTQYNSLESCLKLRNNCAHPGKFQIMKPNLEAYFSDLKTVIFENKNI